MNFDILRSQLLRRSRLTNNELLLHPRLNPVRIRPVNQRLAHAPNSIKTPYRPLNTGDRRRIVYWRFGSLDDFRNARCSIAEVARKLRLPWTTVKYTLSAFKA